MTNEANETSNHPAEIRPTLADWVAWVDRVGGQWVSREDLALIGKPDDRTPTVNFSLVPAEPR